MNSCEEEMGLFESKSEFLPRLGKEWRKWKENFGFKRRKLAMLSLGFVFCRRMKRKVG